MKFARLLAGFRVQVKDQTSVCDGQIKTIRACRNHLPFTANWLKEVFLEQIEYGNTAFLFDLGRRRRQARVI